MSLSSRRLPSLNALATFEAAARLRSFSSAARELNVSQPAVSRQVKVLERDLGFRLFKRGYRAVELTTEGRVLGEVLSGSLETIARTVEDLRGPEHSQTLRIGSTVAFAHFWLLPRLQDFRHHHPSLKVRVVALDDEFDLRNREVDVVMRFGTPPFEDGQVIATRQDEVFPVCSPALRERVGGLTDLRALLDLPLISTETRRPSWMDWPSWLQAAGLGELDPPMALHFNYYTDAISAAVAGQGVALGWNFIIGDLVASGQLVRLCEQAVPSQATFNMVVPRSPRNRKLVDQASLWFRNAFGATRE